MDFTDSTVATGAPTRLTPVVTRIIGKSGERGRDEVRLCGLLGSLLNFAVANTRSTDANAAAGAIHQRANRLQIHIPAALRNVMGVADSIAELRTLSTNCANLCHRNLPDAKENYSKRDYSRQPWGLGNIGLDPVSRRGHTGGGIRRALAGDGWKARRGRRTCRLSHHASVCPDTGHSAPLPVTVFTTT